jgi:hypothetical protein
VWVFFWCFCVCVCTCLSAPPPPPSLPCPTLLRSGWPPQREFNGSLTINPAPTPAPTTMLVQDGRSCSNITTVAPATAPTLLEGGESDVAPDANGKVEHSHVNPAAPVLVEVGVGRVRVWFWGLS